MNLPDDTYSRNKEGLTYKREEWSQDLDKLVKNIRRWKCRYKYWERARELAGKMNIYARPSNAEAVYKDIEDIYLTRLRKFLRRGQPEDRDFLSLPPQRLHEGHEIVMKALQAYVHLRAVADAKEVPDELFSGQGKYLEDTILVYVPDYELKKPEQRSYLPALAYTKPSYMK